MLIKLAGTLAIKGSAELFKAAIRLYFFYLKAKKRLDDAGRQLPDPGSVVQFIQCFSGAGIKGIFLACFYIVYDMMQWARSLAAAGSLCNSTGRIAITGCVDAAAAGVAASPGSSMPPFVLWRSALAAKVEGFDLIWAIDSDDRYITYSSNNPPPMTAGSWCRM